MLYLFLDQNAIKLMSLKKSVMGQYETFFFDKLHQVELIKSGRVTNIDIIASAVKEALDNSKNKFREKDVYLILPQQCFSFLRTSIPPDIASSALFSFINDKARTEWQVNLDDYNFDYVVEQSDGQSVVNLYAIKKTVLAEYQQAFALINHRIVNIIPDTLSYFKLFEKTLRKEKMEKILYATYEENNLSGFLYDSGGLIIPDKWQAPLEKNASIEKVLKERVAELNKIGHKMSRLILSGQSSETIRQDTFTKDVGLWTNPLKRIITGFYQEYLKQLVTADNKPFSILKFDVCFGAFIFSMENKQFSLLKRSAGMKMWSTNKISLPKLNLPMKEIIIFISSFVLSFLAFLLISKSKINFSFINDLAKTPLINKPISPTPTNSPTPSPTPSFKKDELKIKILNGSGTAGKATELKDILKDKGYGEILTGNADNFDYVKTEVQTKKNRQAATTWIKDDLKNSIPNLKFSTLSEDQASDIVIIIGKDFE